MPKKDKEDPLKMAYEMLHHRIVDDSMSGHRCEHCGQPIKTRDVKAVMGPGGRVVYYHKAHYDRQMGSGWVVFHEQVFGESAWAALVEAPWVLA
jgi:hypothetical protein